MKVNITIDDEEQYEQLLAKLKAEGGTLKQFFADKVSEYLTPTPDTSASNLAEVFITELALQLVEHKLATVPKTQFSDPKASDYQYINQACLQLLEVIPSKYADHLLKISYDQDEALNLIGQVFFD